VVQRTKRALRNIRRALAIKAGRAAEDVEDVEAEVEGGGEDAVIDTEDIRTKMETQLLQRMLMKRMLASMSMSTSMTISEVSAVVAGEEGADWEDRADEAEVVSPSYRAALQTGNTPNPVVLHRLALQVHLVHPDLHTWAWEDQTLHSRVLLHRLDHLLVITDLLGATVRSDAMDPLDATDRLGAMDHSVAMDRLDTVVSDHPVYLLGTGTLWLIGLRPTYLEEDHFALRLSHLMSTVMDHSLTGEGELDLPKSSYSRDRND